MKFIKHIKHIFIVLLIFISSTPVLYGSHVLGAEISYKHIVANQYQFTVKVYRDCNECKFNNNGGGGNTQNCNDINSLKVKWAFNTPYYRDSVLKDIALTRIKIEDITPTCNSALSRCNINSTINYGYEQQTFEGVCDFGDLAQGNKCMFDIGLSIASRNTAINPSMASQNFFNFTTINLCENIRNTSVNFNEIPQFILYQNKTHHLSLGIENTDNDSLFFSLKPAIINRTIPIVYEVGRSAINPFGIWCNYCLPNPNIQPSEGFYINHKTGDITFTPTILSQGGVIVIECEEWKKNNSGQYYLAGVVRRDFYAEIASETNNLPELLNESKEIKICEGDALNYPLNIFDRITPGNAPDTVNVSMFSNINNFNLITTNSNTPPYKTYSLKLNNTIGLKGKHFITLLIEDNHCPLKGIVSKTLLLNILEKPKFNYTYEVKNCGNLSVKSSTHNNVRWTIKTLNADVLKQAIGRNTNVQLPNGGKYVIEAKIEGNNTFCELIKIDTINISNFKNPEMSFAKTMKACKETTVNIEPNIFNTFDDFEIFINEKIAQFPFSKYVTKNESITIKVVQKNGCAVEEKIELTTYPVLNYSKLIDTFCSNSVFPILNKKLLNYQNAEINAIDLSANNPNISLNQINNAEWAIDIIEKKETKAQIFSLITDKNNCTYFDTSNLVVIEPNEITTVLEPSICRNIGNYKLPTNANGSWECLNGSNFLNGNTLTINENTPNELILNYTETNKCTNTKNFKLLVSDTTPLSLQIDRNIEVCENATNIELKANPNGGKWQGDNVLGNEFIVNNAKEKNSIYYIYKNNEGCISKETVNINVVKIPEISIQTPYNEVCVGDMISLEAASNTGAKGYWYTTGEGRFTDAGNLITSYIPSIKDVQKSEIEFLYTLQSNTICGNVSKGIKVKIKEGPTGQIIDNYPKTLCEPANMTFESSFKNIDKQNWYVNDSLIHEFDYEFKANTTLKAGIYHIKTKVENEKCKGVAISQTIAILPSPVAKITTSPILKITQEYPRVYMKDVTNFRSGASTNWYVNNEWIGDGKEIYHNVPTNKDTVWLKMKTKSNVSDCNDSITKYLVFTPINLLYVPDAFSPDMKGPDDNNVFKVKGPVMKYFYLQIFNKWGEIVFLTKDMNQGWDGISNTKPCQQGVYFYKINSTDLDGISRDYSGTLTLIR